MRVMVVDDNAPARGALQELLAELDGVEPAGEASSGEEAVARVDEIAPDLVVMDWSMPGMDGIEATTRIRAARPGVRVVAWTSTDESVLHRAFADAGAEAIFVKERVTSLLDFIAASVARV